MFGRLLCLPLLFCIWSPHAHFLLIVNRKQDVKKGFAFHYKISRSASNDDGEINFLHHPPGASKRKKNKEPHAKNSVTSQHNHHISKKCAAAYFLCHFVLKIRFFMIHFATENKFVCLYMEVGLFCEPISIHPHIPTAACCRPRRPARLQDPGCSGTWAFISIFMNPLEGANRDHSQNVNAGFFL